MSIKLSIPVNLLRLQIMRDHYCIMRVVRVKEKIRKKISFKKRKKILADNGTNRQNIGNGRNHRHRQNQRKDSYKEIVRRFTSNDCPLYKGSFLTFVLRFQWKCGLNLSPISRIQLQWFKMVAADPVWLSVIRRFVLNLRITLSMEMSFLGLNLSSISRISS